MDWQQGLGHAGLLCSGEALGASLLGFVGGLGGESDGAPPAPPLRAASSSALGCCHSNSHPVVELQSRSSEPSDSQQDLAVFLRSVSSEQVDLNSLISTSMRSASVSV